MAVPFSRLTPAPPDISGNCGGFRCRTRGRIHAGKELVRASQRGTPARDQPFAPRRGQDRQGLSRLWSADLGRNLRRRCRAHAGARALRFGKVRFATYAVWWIKAAIQEYVLRSWSLVKMCTTTSQKKLFFNLRKAKNRISVLDEGDMRPDQVKLLAERLGVAERNVIDMNRRLGGDASLNAPI